MALTTAPPSDSSAPPAPVPTPRDFTPSHLADKILRSQSNIEGERKRVTVLFADVKGSMDLAAALGPEIWHELLHRFFEVLNEGVHRLEGSVNQYTGDGIMALFGAPIAHEDHAQRACYSALHLRTQLRHFSQDVKRRYGVDFAVRMGLNSGEVVVGKIGDDLRMDYTALGHTVGLAQRMESLASGGSIYLAEDTVALVAGYFELEDLGDFTVKGSDKPVRVHELLGAGELTTRFDVSRSRGLVRFVGRDAEMQTLERALEQARAGNGQVVGLVADAGTGKSRLSFEFTEHCRSLGLAVNQGRCVAHGKNIPFLPVLEIIRGYYGITTQDDNRTAREKVAGRMLLLDAAFRDALPVLFEFLGIGDPSQPAPVLPVEARQRQLFGVLRSITQAGGGLGQEASVVMFEDLHWIDAASQAWLSQWVEATAGSRTLLLVNFRPEYHAAWMQRSHYQQIALAPLSPEAIGDLLSELIGTSDASAQLAKRIHTHTAGNPFFAEEVVQSLIESGQLVGSRGCYELAAPIDKLEVPPSVQGILGARIDRLGEREKHVLQVASAIGKNFPETVLRPVASLSESDLAEALSLLRASEFVHEVSLFPVAEYTFKHPLTQQVALDSMLGPARRALHAAVARVLESLSKDLDEDAALLATHWDEAAEPIVATRWHLRAADWIGARDVHETMRHAQAAIQGLRDRQEDAEATSLLALAAARLMNLGWRIGMTEEDAAELYRDGKRWAQAANNLEAEARLAGGYGAVLALRGDLAGCLRVADEFAVLADRSGNEELRIVELGWMSYPRMICGRLEEVLQRLTVAMAACERNPEFGVEFLGASLQGLLFNWLILVQARTERFDIVQATVEQGLRWDRQRGELENEALMSGDSVGALALYSGETAQPLAVVRRGLALAEELATPIAQFSALRGYAICLHVSGDSAGAIELFLQWREETHSHQVDLEYAPLALSVMAQAQAATGQAEAALQTATEALEQVTQAGSNLLLPDVYHGLAIVHLALGNLDEADDALDHMDTAVRAIGAVNLAPLVLRSRAEVLAKRGDAQGSAKLLSAALAGFDERGATGHARALREAGVV